LLGDFALIRKRGNRLSVLPVTAAQWKRHPQPRGMTFQDPDAMSDAKKLKRLAAERALEYVEDGMIVGVGTGSTVRYFIDGLGPQFRDRIHGAVSSSEQSTALLRASTASTCSISMPSARCRCTSTAPTNATRSGRLIKGGGAALTREKIIAAASKKFVCVDRPEPSRSRCSASFRCRWK
jgi:hypothetical protein